MSGTWSVGLSVAVLGAGLLVVGVAGSRLVRVADELADRTHLGEAFFGAVFLGAITSLGGVVTSVTAAADGFPQLAHSNAVGGIAAQTLFLVVADAAYRNVNLEHAAASVPNMISAALLVLLLGVALGASLSPDVTVLGVHPASPLLILVYLAGLRLVRQARREPMWTPQQSAETRTDEGTQEAGGGSLAGPAIQLVLAGAVVAIAGWAIARAGASVAAQTGLSETLVGVAFTSTATSVPELVTTVAAVRTGALTLAVAGIVGGNAFDVLFLAFADPAYRAGSLYHAVGPDQLLVLVMALLMTAVLILGLLSRERRGFANVGGEGVAIVLLYAGTIALVAGD